MTERTTTIKNIQKLKNAAIKKGHDFPSEGINEASTETLQNFLEEIKTFIKEN